MDRLANNGDTTAASEASETSLEPSINSTEHAQPSRARLKVHLINPLNDYYGGSERRTLELYNLLKDKARVTFWSERRPDGRIPAEYPIKLLRARYGQLPIGGVIVFVGFYYNVWRWIRWTKAERRIIICNTTWSHAFEFLFERVSSAGKRPVELVFACEALRQSFQLPGFISASPIPIDKFTVKDHTASSSSFRVGRLSRDHETKHHEDASAFYCQLLEAGCSVALMGGTLLRDRLPHHAHLELLPAGTCPAAEFLSQLDCFVYRTHSSWFETFGRVVFEAMASGLPVVVHRHAGYVEFLTHGEDAFIFDSDDEAFEIIMRLKADPELRRRIGSNARRRVEAMYGPEGNEKLSEFFLSYESRVEPLRAVRGIGSTES